MTHVEVAEGVRLRVDDRGSGPAVVLLHGFTGDASTMATLAGPLAREARVVVPDLVGHGGSTSPPDDRSHSVDAMAGHVEVLADELGLGPVHLVGYSMGGRVALTLACRRPERLGSLTLIGASAGLDDPADRAARRTADEALAVDIEQAGLEAFVDRWMADPLFATQSRLGDDFLARARVQRLGNDPTALARSLRGGGTGAMTPLRAELAACPVPTRLVAGADDPKFAAIARELVDLMPDAEAVIVGSAGHAVHLEQPDAVLAVVREQIRSAG